MLRLLSDLLKHARKHPRLKWVFALIAAALAILAFTLGGCTSTSSLQPTPDGGWEISANVRVSGSRTVLPNAVPATRPAEPPTPR